MALLVFVFDDDFDLLAGFDRFAAFFDLVAVGAFVSPTFDAEAIFTIGTWTFRFFSSMDGFLNASELDTASFFFTVSNGIEGVGWSKRELPFEFVSFDDGNGG